ncbi:MAG: argininosuccinate lyase [Phycisphaerales bacterium]|nr:argininosuccinate lyase [Phycisphaerales bacterium]
MALWGGRFDKAADPLFREINDSLPFDYRLAAQDIAGSVAWAGAIQRAGVLTADEHRRLVSALADLAVLVEENPRAPLEEQEKAATESPGTPEDIHSWVEAELIRAVGDLGKKLHTGRSRNDQAATGLRLWVRCEIDARLAEVRAAQRSLVALAEREAATILPGYTHLQRAQPVLMAHWALAYFEMLERDAARLAGARRRANLCPLGSAALAGTTYPIDRAALARDLGFDAPTANSLDAVADRDFVVETLAAASLCAVHLSRLGEELILWSSGEFGFVELDDSVTSGSSLMPQKKNPDALELLRGKCGRIAGAHAALTVTLKGLPLAYNKDMQEDKEPLFDAMGSLSLCLRIVPRVLDGMKVDRGRCREAAAGGHSNATELADYLVGKGVPFRDAHEVVGRVVRHALAAGRALEALTLDEFRKFDARIGPDVLAALTLEAGLTRREVPGGTGPQAVAAAIARAKRSLGGGAA